MNALSFLNQGFSSITADSRNVQQGGLFLAYPGEKNDGRDYIAQAVANGAAGVIFEVEDFVWDAAFDVPHVATKHLKNHAGEIAAAFYANPSEKLWVVGVTGTNGKTSCSQWLSQILSGLSKKTAVVGTLGNGFPDALQVATNTTPDAVLLQSMLADYLKQGANSVVMEVSSHGLQQGRVNGVQFDVAVFTNLTRDHLDYHGSMEAYAAEKAKLFDWPTLKCAVVNVDDVFGQHLATKLKQRQQALLTYGITQDADVRVMRLDWQSGGFNASVQTPQGIVELNANLIGRFNVYNVLAVLATLLATGITLENAAEAITQIKSISGRMEQIGGGNLPLVVVDYAHTPDALEKVLQTLREQTQGKLICVFGCGGDRDAGKRSLMGQTATQLADIVVVTSDNPRYEDSMSIIKEVVSNLTGATFKIEPDRARAIQDAIQNASKGDVVLIAGKGHESYQEISGVKYPFSDFVHAQAGLQLRGEVAA